MDLGNRLPILHLVQEDASVLGGRDGSDAHRNWIGHGTVPFCLRNDYLEYRGFWNCGRGSPACAIRCATAFPGPTEFARRRLTKLVIFSSPGGVACRRNTHS